MKLYLAPGACSLADHIALHETGLHHEIETVDLKAKTTESGRDFREINPKGYVPALQLDDGEVLTENIAILLYLADTTGRLIPKDGIARWRVIETAAFITTELHKGFKPFFNPNASQAEKDEAGEQLRDRFQRMEDRLGDRAFIVGEDMTIADCYLFVMLMWAGKQGVEVQPRLKAYFERLKQRDGVKGALRMEGLE